MATLGLTLLALSAFGLLLAAGYAIFSAILGTPEARDARSRNPKHEPVEAWWTRDDPNEWTRPRQRQPLP